jgi:hypothetical protein
VGGPDDNSGTGAVWVFTRSGGVWTQQGSKLVGNGAVVPSNKAPPSRSPLTATLPSWAGLTIARKPGRRGSSPAAMAPGPSRVPSWSAPTRLEPQAKAGPWHCPQTATPPLWAGLTITHQTSIAASGQRGSLPAAAVSGPSKATSWSAPTRPDMPPKAIPSRCRRRQHRHRGWALRGLRGAAWVYTRSGAVWTQQGSKLVGSGAVGFGDQGWSVALSADGNTAIVGGPDDNSSIGAAWVFTRSGGFWTQQSSKLVGTGAVISGAGVLQGYSVALSADGNTAIIGGPFDNADVAGGNTVGAAWVFVVQSPAPTLVVAPATNMVAAGNQGGPFTPPSFQYQVSATVGSINYSISGYPNWLTPSSTSGIASTTATNVTFTVNSNANSLAASDNATITFTNMDTGQGTQTRTATLTVNPPALLVTPTTRITASGTHGGPFSPTSFHYSLSAASGTVKYTITNVPSWLTASPRSGTVTTKAASVTFRINATAADRLSAGTYISIINFNNTTNNQVTTRVATLAVNPKQYTITVRALPSADGAVGGGGTFAEGTSHTVTAAPNTGHTFVHWTENGRVVSASESYTFTLNGNSTLVADFR